MSLLHSFYCWGHVFLVAASTAFFAVFGMENWRILACLWALVPFANIFYFMLVPIYPIVAEGTKQMSLRELLGQKVFWLLLVMMVCAGASEQAMSQWSSAFAEKALGVSKTIGDLAGPCAFAVFMGTARALYGKYSDMSQQEYNRYLNDVGSWEADRAYWYQREMDAAAAAAAAAAASSGSSRSSSQSTAKANTTAAQSVKNVANTTGDALAKAAEELLRKKNASNDSWVAGYGPSINKQQTMQTRK
jgi:hypothetical protein